MVQYITILNTSLHWLWQYFKFQKTHTPISQGSYGVPHVMASQNENAFCVTDPLWGEATGHQWIPLTKAQ